MPKYKHTPEAKLEYPPCWHIVSTIYNDLFRMNVHSVVCCWCKDTQDLLDSWKPDLTPREHGPYAPGITVSQ